VEYSYLHLALVVVHLLTGCRTY